MTGLGGQMSIVRPPSVGLPRKRLCSAATGRHGASLVSLARWAMGLVVEMKSVVAAMPAGAIRRQFDRQASRSSAGAVHGRGLVAGWNVDVLHRDDRERRSHLAATFSDGHTGAGDVGAGTEEGVHFAPDGRSFVTSVGTSQSTLWLRDSRGERQITSEGYSYMPSLSADGKKLYYLVRSNGPRELQSGRFVGHRRETGQRQRLLPDFESRTTRFPETVSVWCSFLWTTRDVRGVDRSLNGQTPPRNCTLMGVSRSSVRREK
jgi:hypothetical protein